MNPELIWVVIFNDGTQYPAAGFLFSEGPQLAAEHGGVKGMALIPKDNEQTILD